MNHCGPSDGKAMKVRKREWPTTQGMVALEKTGRSKSNGSNKVGIYCMQDSVPYCSRSIAIILVPKKTSLQISQLPALRTHLVSYGRACGKLRNASSVVLHCCYGIKDWHSSMIRNTYRNQDHVHRIDD